MKRLDYTGKDIFVGIDVHKKTYAVAVIFDGQLIKRDTMKAYPDTLVRYLHKRFPGAKIKSAYEAGFSGFRLHRHLRANGIENIVVHAASIETKANDRVKTDKRDAVKIATQLSTNRLEGINVPTPEEEDRRELTRLRETLVKEKKKVASRLKMKGHYYGLLEADDNRKISLKWIAHILSLDLGTELRYTLEYLTERWKDIRAKIAEIDKRLKVQASQDEKNEKTYRSLKGIGPLASRVLSNELGDLLRFSSERQLFSYVGLTPSEYSSGEHQRRGHITRQGKSMLRKILVECSWVAIRYDEELQEIYNRIAHRAGGKRAIVAIARRLIGRLRACFKENRLYEPGQRPCKHNQKKPLEEGETSRQVCEGCGVLETA